MGKHETRWSKFKVLQPYRKDVRKQPALILGNFIQAAGDASAPSLLE